MKIERIKIFLESKNIYDSKKICKDKKVNQVISETFPNGLPWFTTRNLPLFVAELRNRINFSSITFIVDGKERVFRVK